MLKHVAQQTSEDLVKWAVLALPVLRGRIDMTNAAVARTRERLHRQEEDIMRSASPFA